LRVSSRRAALCGLFRPAALADGKGSFSIEEVEIDAPGPGEVRVELHAAGVCHTDHASLSWTGPLLLGHEGAGYIATVTPGA
jgi:S-(hydroxymethyl)glutathione dehydrogenase/alcohol dehydrogenase